MSRRKSRPVRSAAWVLALLSLLCAGCPQGSSQPAREVVVYCALDTEFSRPILDEFTRETGIAVRPKFDVEATKTVGLAEAIIAEAERPRCDLFWNNEILHTLRLAERGLLDVYAPPQASHFPAAFRDSGQRWHGFAARARVLIVNTNLVPEADRPFRVRDLADEKWKGKCGLAKPLFGTTATHVASLFAKLGDDEAAALLKEFRDNDVQIMAGNRQVARAVATGQLAWGLTDTDDAVTELEAGQSVVIVYPDQEEGGWGTLFIPNTLAVIKGGPHADEARKLADYLLTADVEKRLAEGPSAQIPLHEEAPPVARVATPQTIRAMQVDFAQAAERWETARTKVREILGVE